MNRLTYKQQFIGLLVASVLLFWLIYQLAVSETLETRDKYKTLLANKEQLSTAGSRVLFYERELKKMDSLIGADAFAGNYTQELLLRKITDFGLQRNVTIVDFQKPHFALQDDYGVYTYRTTIRGGFHDLLRLLYELESNPFPGIFKSAGFALKTEPGEKVPELTLTLFVQEVKKEKPRA